MAKFTIINGSIKKNRKYHLEGSELELTQEEADHLNRKGKCVELSALVNAKADAEAKAKKDIADAEAKAKAELEAEAKKHAAAEAKAKAEAEAKAKKEGGK